MSEYDGPLISRVGRVVTIVFINEENARLFVENFNKVWMQKHKRLQKQQRVTKKDLKKSGVWAQRTERY